MNWLVFSGKIFCIFLESIYILFWSLSKIFTIVTKFSIKSSFCSKRIVAEFIARWFALSSWWLSVAWGNGTNNEALPIFANSDIVVDPARQITKLDQSNSSIILSEYEITDASISYFLYFSLTSLSWFIPLICFIDMLSEKKCYIAKGIVILRKEDPWLPPNIKILILALISEYFSSGSTTLSKDGRAGFPVCIILLLVLLKLNGCLLYTSDAADE